MDSQSSPQSKYTLIGYQLNDRYTLTDFIATGGMAAVYLAYDQRLDRYVALKIMHQQYSSDPIFVDKFVREAQSAARLDDRNVIGIYDQGTAASPYGNELVYLIMEYVHGHTIREILNSRKSLTVGDSLQIVIPALRGLAAAHDAHLIHRDVKPENILISDSTIKLSDFGLAKSLTSTTQTGTTIGTIAYLSPETITSGNSTKQSDVYAMGVVLYELLTGNLPFQGDHPQHIAYQHVHETAPEVGETIPQISSELNELIAWALLKDPQSRPANARVFLEHLEEISADLSLKEKNVHGPQMLSIPLPPRPTHNKELPPQNNTKNSAEQKTKSLGDPPHDSENTTILHSPLSDSDKTHVLTPQNTVSGDGHLLKHTQNFDSLPANQSTPHFFEGSAEEDTSSSLYNSENIQYSPSQSSPEPRGTSSPQAHIPKYQFKSRRNKVMGWTIGIICILIICAVTVWAFTAGPAASTPFPELSGYSQQEAKKSLDKASFYHIEYNEVYNDDISSGKVIDTNFSARQLVPKFQNVKVTISKGPQLFSTPDVTGKTQRQAKTLINNNSDLPMGTVKEKYSSTIAAGQVISQDPAGGSQKPRNTPINLIISKGPPPKVIPSVIGKNKSQAKQALEHEGFIVEISQEEVYSSTIKEGKVASQSPESGTQQAQGSTVLLYISKGPEMVSIPPDIQELAPEKAQKS